MFFCPIHTKFINTLTNNRQEQYKIFTSFFHLKFLEKTAQLFIDATFKSSPKNYYQLLNIIAYNQKENFIMPVAFILISSKSYSSYIKIFKDIKFLLVSNNIRVKFKNIIFLCDFEKSLIKSIREESHESKLNGCYFHYVKSIWKKIRNLGLAKKNFWKLLN